jgi:hypothetical protein
VRVRRGVLVAACAALLALLPSCKTVGAIYDVIEEAAPPAVVGAVLAATGAGPAVVLAGILATDVTLQAAEGQKAEDELKTVVLDAIKSDARIEVKEMWRDQTRGMAFARYWKEIAVLVLLAWLLKSPGRMGLAFRAWLAKKLGRMPPDGPN